MDPVAATVIALIAGAGAITAALTKYEGTRAAAQRWKAIARNRRGLDYHDSGGYGRPAPELRGDCDGVTVHVDLCDGRPYGQRGRVTRVRVELTGMLPEGLSVGPEWPAADLLRSLGLGDVAVGVSRLDDALRIGTADPPAAVAALSDRAVVERVEELLTEGRRVQIRDRELTVIASGLLGLPAHDLMIDTAALGRALNTALVGRWRRLARVRGLALREDERKLRLDGAWDGLPLIVHVGRTAGDPTSHTTIRVQVDAPLPPGLWITAQTDDAPADGLALGDPIVGRLLCVRGIDAALAAELLDDDELRPALLEVLHGHPGSAVREGAVVLELPEFVSRTPAEPIELAARLARQLARRSSDIFR